jgi:hypothetical protein
VSRFDNWDPPVRNAGLVLHTWVHPPTGSLAADVVLVSSNSSTRFVRSHAVHRRGTHHPKTPTLTCRPPTQQDRLPLLLASAPAASPAALPRALPLAAVQYSQQPSAGRREERRGVSGQAAAWHVAHGNMRPAHYAPALGQLLPDMSFFKNLLTWLSPTAARKVDRTKSSGWPPSSMNLVAGEGDAAAVRVSRLCVCSSAYRHTAAGAAVHRLCART